MKCFCLDIFAGRLPTARYMSRDGDTAFRNRTTISGDFTCLDYYRRTHHLEQSAGQCALSSVSVDLSPASENVPGLVP